MTSRPVSALLLVLFAAAAGSQAREGTMSEKEIDSLRNSAYVPSERIAAYEKVLDTRAEQLDRLLKARHHVSFDEDLHDLLDQVAGIADELNDNLDDYRAKRRDVRKALPKLLTETDRWTKALEATPTDDADKIVRKLALDAVADVHTQAGEMQSELEEYFTAHPEAAKAEAERLKRAQDAGAPQ